MTVAWWRRVIRKPFRRSKCAPIRPSARPRLEPLEDRDVPCVTVGANVNISHMAGNQVVGTAATTAATLTV
jgi:hypothetical protein